MTAACDSFASLPLPPATLDNLQRLGYTSMTPIQAASLPLALAGKDLIAQAKTGSGKTAAFVLALLANLNPIQILGGRKEKIRPGDVLGALTKDLGYAAAQIGKINVNELSRPTSQWSAASRRRC